MRKKTIIYLSIFLASFIFSKSCFAQEKDAGKGFSLMPFFKEIALDSSQKEVSFDLEIENKTDQVAVFKLSVLDFGSLNESGGVAFLGSNINLEKKYSLVSWVSLEKDALALNPKEKQTIKVSILNKDSLSPGGHYGAILAKIEEDGSESQESSKVAFDPSFASLMFVRKTGGEVYGFGLRERDLNGNIFSVPSSAKLRFQNSGNVHLVPRGTIKILDPFKREIAKGIINSESAFMLPETFRVLNVPIEKISTAFFPGRYEAVFNYRYDGKEEAVSESSFVYIFPPAFILLIALSLLTVGCVLLKRHKKKKNGK